MTRLIAALTLALSSVALGQGYVQPPQKVSPFNPPLFRTRTPYFNGQLSYSISTGPLVGDGGIAVLSSNYTGTTVSCWQPDAYGNLVGMVNTTVSGNPRFTAIADFNEDGISDFAVTNRTTTVQTFFGSGQCNFTAGPTMTMAAGTAGQGIVAVKLAGQTHVSLVVADRSSTNVNVFVGGGDGGFLSTVPVFAGCTSAGAYQIAVGDLNNDQNIDLVMPCNGPNIFATMFGAPDGGFATAVTTPTRSTNGADALALGDFNGDGVLDVAVGELSGGATESVALQLYLGEYQYNTENINLFQFMTPPLSFPFNSGHGSSGSQGVATGDFNGDGRTDVVASVYNTSPLGVQFFAGNAKAILDNTFGVTSLLPPSTYTNTHLSPIYLAAADLNGDGVSDVIVPNFGDGTTGNGIPALWTLISAAPPLPVSLPVGAAVPVEGFAGGNMGVSAGPEVQSYVNCQSAYATYLGVLPNRRSISVQCQYDTTPVWIGQYNVVPAPGLPFSLSDGGFVDAGPGQPGIELQPGGTYSVDVNVGPAWSRPPPNSLNQTQGLFCTKLSGAQDGTWDGGWCVVTELP